MTETELTELKATLAAKETELSIRELRVTSAEVANQTSSLAAATMLTDQQLTAWQKLIDMATHFNELCLSVRRFALATLATLLAASGIAYRFAGGIALINPDRAGFVLPFFFSLFLVPLALFVVVRGKPTIDSEGNRTSAFWKRLGAFVLVTFLSIVGSYAALQQPVHSVHIASLFLGTAAVVWILCFLMDRFWYHELLRGVIAQCSAIEARLTQLGDISVTKQIRTYSHASLNLSAGAKLSVFYLVIYTILIVSLAALLLNPPTRNPAGSDAFPLQPGSFEAYPLASMPAFPQGSADLSVEAKAAVCTARAALAALRVDTALVVGRHDQVELSQATKKRFGANSGLARARAETVANALRDGPSCSASPVTHVLALESAPRNVGAMVDSKSLQADRQPEVHGLRIVVSIPARTGWASGN